MENKRKKTIEEFKELADKNKLFHAYLFFGQSPEKSYEIAESLANYLETGDFKKPEKFLNDFMAIKPNEFGNIGIDQIRDLQGFLYQFPVVSKKRIAVVWKAGALTADSQGAILKIIEEPPQKALVILIADQEDSLFKTILSRVHKIYFSPVDGVSGKKEKIGEELTEENMDKFFKNSLIDLGGDLRQNINAVKEVLNRIVLMKQYNLNNRLQLRVINNFLKTKQSFKKPKSNGRKKA